MGPRRLRVLPDHGSVARRARRARSLCRLPHRSIEHQRRAPGRDVSTNTSGQSLLAHSRMRPENGPASSSIISRARVDSARVARTGAAHPAAMVTPVEPGANGGADAEELVSSGVSGGVDAAWLMAVTASAGSGRRAARAWAASQIAWRRTLAAASSWVVAGTVRTAARGGWASHSPRAAASWRVSKTAYLP